MRKFHTLFFAGLIGVLLSVLIAAPAQATPQVEQASAQQAAKFPNPQYGEAYFYEHAYYNYACAGAGICDVTSQRASTYDQCYRAGGYYAWIYPNHYGYVQQVPYTGPEWSMYGGGYASAVRLQDGSGCNYITVTGNGPTYAGNNHDHAWDYVYGQCVSAATNWGIDHFGPGYNDNIIALKVEYRASCGARA